jgi:hypothetical protein
MMDTSGGILVEYLFIITGRYFMQILMKGLEITIKFVDCSKFIPDVSTPGSEQGVNKYRLLHVT